MGEIKLLSKLYSNINSKPRFVGNSTRSIKNRILALDRTKEFFDGDRSNGYGGYKYDGRWISVAKDIIKHFHLSKGQKVLDIGCAKGFLVKDLVDLGIDAVGIDISKYAIKNLYKYGIL